MDLFKNHVLISPFPLTSMTPQVPSRSNQKIAQQWAIDHDAMAHFGTHD
jgi:hypothetical protein